jgi:hypothetical protein
MASPANGAGQNGMDEGATMQAVDPGVANGLDRRTLLTGASRLALMAVAGGPLWELIGSGPQAVREAWIDSTYWSDGTGWTDA